MEEKENKNERQNNSLFIFGRMKQSTMKDQWSLEFASKMVQ